MKSILTIILLCVGLNLSAQLTTSVGEVTRDEIRITYQFEKIEEDGRKGMVALLDIGAVRYPALVNNETKEVIIFNSPQHLIDYIEAHGYNYIGVESWMEGGEYRSCRIFIRNK